jgi:hypothetical protein
MQMSKKNLLFFGIVILIVIVFCFIKFPLKEGTATLSWVTNTETDFAGYKIYYGTSTRTDKCPPGGYSNKLDVAKTTTPLKPSYQIKNLATGKTYYFSVTSYDKFNNESCFSEEMNKTILPL